MLNEVEEGWMDLAAVINTIEDEVFSGLFVRLTGQSLGVRIIQDGPFHYSDEVESFEDDTPLVSRSAGFSFDATWFQ